MTDNLWYIYEHEIAVCNECNKFTDVAVWHNEVKEEFISVCAECDKPHLANK